MTIEPDPTDGLKSWFLSGTVASNRRNLFDLTPGDEHQVATLVSGSRSQLSRFENDLAMIEAAPLMLSYLRAVIANGTSTSSSGEGLRQRIRELIERLDRSDR
jgi:hypothetical protein